jgi:hypothetical protein
MLVGLNLLLKISNEIGKKPSPICKILEITKTHISLAVIFLERRVTFNASKSRRAVARPAGDSESHVRQCAMGLSFATSKENFVRRKSSK